MNLHRLSLERIREAAACIDPVFLHSPQFVCEPLCAALGTRVVLKVETLNPLRCFKGRGADYFAASVPAGTPLVTASSGNLGQAMAYVCRKRGLPLEIFAAQTANALKLERMRELGATVRLYGDDFDAAKEEAKRHCQRTGALMVEDGREPRLSEGAGSIAVELLGFPEPIDVLVVSLGGGALLGGMARWCKAMRPELRVVGVVPRGAPCMERSYRARTRIELPTMDTIAEGMATRSPVPEALADICELVDDVLMVEDDSMVQALRLAHRHVGVVLEASGAAGLAAVLEHPEHFRERTVATVLCGGNLSEAQRTQWLR